MYFRAVRFALVLSACCMMSAMAYAQEEKKAEGTAPAAEAPAAQAPVHSVPGPGCGDGCGGCGPTMRTIQVVECVPETYLVKRTGYKRVCREECYTAYKCVTEPVCKTRTYTVMVRKPVCKDVVKTVYDRVPVQVQKTVMRPHWETQTVTVMKSRRVDRGHYVYSEVPAPFKTLCNRLQWRMDSFGHNSCCNPCDPCCSSKPCPPAPATRCVKKWCSNWVTECYPVTCCKKVCVMRPETICCTEYKCVPRQITCKVTEYVCEPKVCTENYTCCVTKRIPYQCKRQVWTCVPYEYTETCTRYVQRTVCKQVPCHNTCGSSCGSSCCEADCSPCCGSRHSLFGGFNLLSRFRGCGASSCCEAPSCGGCASTGCCN